MLRQLPGQKEPHGSLDLPAGDGGALVVLGQVRGFGCYAFKNVVDVAVHDVHGLAGNAGVRVDLLQDLVDVDGVAFLPPLLLLFVGFRDVLLGFADFSAGFFTDF